MYFSSLSYMIKCPRVFKKYLAFNSVPLHTSKFGQMYCHNISIS